jgi:hypothetical protein
MKMVVPVTLKHGKPFMFTSDKAEFIAAVEKAISRTHSTGSS